MAIAFFVGMSLVSLGLLLAAEVKLSDAGLRIKSLEAQLLQEQENKKFAITYRDTDAAILRKRVGKLEASLANIRKSVLNATLSLEDAIDA